MLFLNCRYELFGTTADGCSRATVDKAWALLMLRYNSDQVGEHIILGISRVVLQY